LDNFTKQICPNCKSEKFKKINDDLIIECICGTIFKDNIEINYITGKQAQLILNITTRQGLHKIVKEKNITIKSQGAGKANLYLETDIKEVAKKTNAQRLKTNPKLKKKIETKKKLISKKKEVIKKSKEEKPKILKNEDKNTNLDDEEFTPLNKIGQSEFLRVEKLLIKNGTYEDLDRSLLLFYSISYQKYINAVTTSAQNDDMTQDDFGNLKIHPHFLVADKCFTHMSKLAAMLGIGVRNRLNLDIKKGKKKSVFDILNKDEEF